MSIKTLFEKQKENNNPTKTLFQKTTQELFEDLESMDYVDQYQNSVDLYLQDVNFATSSNFARFGSARKYYENIVNRITGYFPYDGSKASQLEFQNNLNPFEKYIYLYEYPRTTGYINFSPNGWGNMSGVQTQNYGKPQTLEYISFYNENADNVYDPDNGLRENTRFIFNSGSTIEFWLKKDVNADRTSQTAKEAIFYLGTTGSANKDKRIVLYVSGGTGQQGKIFTEYYTNTETKFSLGFDTGLSTISDSTWHHYALIYYRGSGGYNVDFYFDGIYKSTLTSSETNEDITGSAFMTLGSLGGKVSGSTDLFGYGKLTGSIDEFRFWNTKRNAKQIGLNYFTNVGGGNNSYPNNNIGIYFKFNEGIVGDSNTDSIILDYAGRNCNGLFVGYSSASRSTGSAITSTQEKPEIGTPILYYNHTDVQTYLTDKLYYADEHDYKNNFMLKNSMPAWILNEDGNNGDILTNFLQTLSSYLDTLYLQILSYKTIKNKDYLNYEGKAPPFSDLLLTSNGFDLPALFLNTDIVQSLLNQDSKKTYDESINNLKNIIYKNIYNNLDIIYKSKGTEESIKQLIKNFGVNEEVYSLNIYANNTQFKFNDSYVNKSIKKNYIDLTPFNNKQNSSAVVYQSGSNSFITGTNNNSLSFTLECDAVIPEFPQNYDYLAYKTYTYNTSSIFGIRTATDNNSEISVSGSDPAALKARLMFRDNNGYFSLIYPGASIELNSNVFFDLMKNQHWNLSARLQPVSTGSSFNLIFSGYCNTIGDQFREFSVSSSLTTEQGNTLLSKNKRVYVGAERDNITGSLQYFSIIKGLSIKYWSDYLEDEELIEHAKNPNNYGRLYPYQPYTLDTLTYIPKSETILLHWDFTNATSSDASGNISTVYDLTSGSINGNFYSNSPLNNLIGRLYNGAGYGFASNATVGGVELIYSSEQQIPENLYSNQLINILSTDDDYYTTSIRPQKYFFSLENSMYDIISKNMLYMFASIIEFNNFIGDPANTYKSQYSRLKFFKKLFFNKAQNVPDLDRYVGVYKWIDDALDSILFNLLPASANASQKVRTIVENHILERDKIQYILVPDQSLQTLGGDNKSPVFYPPPIHDPTAIPRKTPIGSSRGIASADNHRIRYIDIDEYIPAEGTYVIRYEIPSSFIETQDINKRARSQKLTVAARVGRTK